MAGHHGIVFYPVESMSRSFWMLYNAEATRHWVEYGNEE